MIANDFGGPVDPDVDRMAPITSSDEPRSGGLVYCCG